jgi:hypothetical protein
VAAKDLITATRAQDALGGATNNTANLTLSANEQTTLADLITSCSDAIEKYCRRRFVSTSFDELYNGDGDRRLLLRQYPVLSVTSVRYRPVTVMRIQNTNTVQNQQARVSVTSTGLSLFRMASGVGSTDNTSTFAAFPTIAGLVNNINSLGNGWNAQLVGDAGIGASASGDYGLWPSADLYVAPSYGDGTTCFMSGLNARGGVAELKLHTYELQGFQIDHRGWLLRAIPYTDPELLHPEDLVWPVGINNFRVQYQAGYNTVPEAVQEACAEWVAYLFWQSKRDPALAHQVPTSGATQGWLDTTPSPGSRPPGRVAALLAPYRRHSIGNNQG